MQVEPTNGSRLQHSTYRTYASVCPAGSRPMNRHSCVALLQGRAGTRRVSGPRPLLGAMPPNPESGLRYSSEYHYSEEKSMDKAVSAADAIRRFSELLRTVKKG